MLIYSDIITGDEIISDSFPMILHDGTVYEVDCAMMETGTVKVDTGANASAEAGDDEGVDDQSVKVNNIIHSFRLQPTSFDKKSFLTYLKSYMKAVKTKLQEAGKSDDEIKAFETGAQKFVKETLVPNFKNYEFYTGESMNPDGMVVLLNYREDGVTPYVTIWKEGVKASKV